MTTVFVLAVLWLIVVVPMIVRRNDERRRERSVDGFGRAMRALGHGSSVSARAVEWGLSGIEFGVNIPGTVGGAVKMNANAYGGQLAEVLEWVDVCGPEGRDRRAPAELGFAYRSSNLESGEVVSAASFALQEGDAAAIKATMAEMRGRRRSLSRANLGLRAQRRGAGVSRAGRRDAQKGNAIRYYETCARASFWSMRTALAAAVLRLQEPWAVTV